MHSLPTLPATHPLQRWGITPAMIRECRAFPEEGVVRVPLELARAALRRPLRPAELLRTSLGLNLHAIATKLFRTERWPHPPTSDDSITLAQYATTAQSNITYAHNARLQQIQLGATDGHPHAVTFQRLQRTDDDHTYCITSRSIQYGCDTRLTMSFNQYGTVCTRSYEIRLPAAGLAVIRNIEPGQPAIEATVRRLIRQLEQQCTTFPAWHQTIDGQTKQTYTGVVIPANWNLANLHPYQKLHVARYTDARDLSRPDYTVDFLASGTLYIQIIIPPHSGLVRLCPNTMPLWTIAHAIC